MQTVKQFRCINSSRKILHLLGRPSTLPCHNYMFDFALCHMRRTLETTNTRRCNSAR